MSWRGPHARPHGGSQAAGSARADARPGRLDHLDDDALAQVPGQAVDARRPEQADQPSSRVAAVIGSRARFVSCSNGMLQIQQHHVGAEPRRLLEHAPAAASDSAER
jgi:hypothetical protein